MNFFKNNVLNPKDAYDLWSKTYDSDDNLMHFLDNQIIQSLLKNELLLNKKVLDIGCGTGRHWPMIMSEKVAELVGCDLSAGMIDQLKEKIPDAKIYEVDSETLPFESNSFDTIISNLTIGYIPNLHQAFSNWTRVLKESGDIILTDYHPELLKRGGTRGFKIGNKTIHISNHLHSLPAIETTAASFNLKTINFQEKVVDDSVRSFYERKSAIHVFEKYKGIPLIYGMHLKFAYENKH